MAAFDTTRTSYGSAPVAGLIARTLYELVSGIIARNDARVTRNAHHSLTDRELEDIGLVRGDIEDISKTH